MKFGVLGFSYNGFEHFARRHHEVGFYTANLGDNAQTIASRHVYRQLGIADTDIVTIDRDRLSAYTGEPVALLMNGVFFNRGLPISKAITPIFVGFCAGAAVIRQHREWLLSHAPIGCRDAETARLMHEMGIDAYVSGCVTMTLPPRQSTPVNFRLLIVYGDGAGAFPATVLKHVPKEMLDCAQFIQHRLPVGEYPLSTDAVSWIERYEMSLLDRYRDEASLVLTPLLHVATPCLAMNVPVVVCRHDRDPRFSLLRDIVPIYTPEEFGSIDWSPLPGGVSAIAGSIVAQISSRIRVIVAGL